MTVLWARWAHLPAKYLGEDKNGLGVVAAYALPSVSSSVDSRNLVLGRVRLYWRGWLVVVVEVLVLAIISGMEAQSLCGVPF